MIYSENLDELARVEVEISRLEDEITRVGMR